MRKQITLPRIKLAYELGRSVFAGRLAQENAAARLEAAGMNPTSANISINNLRQMINGAEYNRAMSIAQTRYFLTAIHLHDGLSGLKAAVRAFSKHLPYLIKTSKNPRPGHAALLAEFQTMLGRRSAQSAIDDFIQKPEGEPNPTHLTRLSATYQRNHVVRAYVLNRARGRCEYCGKEGFELPSGTRYLETHHIITLANQGPDTPENVIALCAHHHREAHFGKLRTKLETSFNRKMKAIEPPPPAGA